VGRVANLRIARPLERRTSGEVVAEHVRHLIFTGVLRPGDRIPQGELATELGVSRLPVREAVIELARDGLVTVAPHSGAFVAPFDAEVLRHHFEIVGLVQGLAAENLAESADREVLARLEALADQIDAAAAAGDAFAVHASTMEFLRVMNLAGGSARQQAVLRALARMLPTGFFAEVPGAAESEQRGAHQILDAIRSGSRDAARRACVAVQRAHAELVIDHLVTRGVLTDEAKG
jgi:DNA-binding GntR family transcriptional regulator